MGDVISSIGIGIGIGTAAVNSIGYREPARYQSNPNYTIRKNAWNTIQGLLYVPLSYF